MERPNIKNFFDKRKVASLTELNKTYLENKELFNYAQSLDNYIDYLEDKLENSDTKPSVIIGLTEEQLFMVTLMASITVECTNQKIITPTQRKQIQDYVLEKLGERDKKNKTNSK